MPGVAVRSRADQRGSHSVDLIDQHSEIGPTAAGAPEPDPNRVTPVTSAHTVGCDTPTIRAIGASGIPSAATSTSAPAW